MGVGHDKFLERGLAMQQIIAKITPIRIGNQFQDPSLLVKRLAYIVEAGHAGIAAPYEVGGGEIELLAHQVVAEGVGDPFIDLVAHLLGAAPGQVGGGGVAVAGGVEEGIQQGPLCHRAGRILEVEGFGQHRVAEAIHGRSEIGADVGVEIDVVAL